MKKLLIGCVAFFLSHLIVHVKPAAEGASGHVTQVTDRPIPDGAEDKKPSVSNHGNGDPLMDSDSPKQRTRRRHDPPTFDLLVPCSLRFPSLAYVVMYISVNDTVLH